MSDNDFLTAFEDCSLRFTHWNHRARVRVAFLYTSRLGLAKAIDRMRFGIKAYNAVHGVEDGPSKGYQETTPQAFMRLIHQALRKHGPFQDSHEFCERNPELLDRRVLLCYYTRDRITEPAAKVCFIEPDIATLDQTGLAFPEFGKRVEGATYSLRPGAYALIADESGRIAAVTTPTGTYLPGGGQEAKESAIEKREVLEECGLTIEVSGPTAWRTSSYSPRMKVGTFANDARSIQPTLRPTVRPSRLTTNSSGWQRTRQWQISHTKVTAGQ